MRVQAPICTAGALVAPQHGIIAFINGTVATFACDNGYRLVGSASAQCVSVQVGPDPDSSNVHFPFNTNVSNIGTYQGAVSVVGSVPMGIAGGASGAFFDNPIVDVGSESTNHIRVTTDLTSHNDFTVAAWVFPVYNVYQSGGLATMTPLALRDPTFKIKGTNINLAITEGVVFDVTGVDWGAGPSPAPNASWTHVAMTLSSANVATLFVNGSLASQKSLFSSAAAVSQLLIGCSNDFSRSFNGYMRDVRLYGRTLSPSELAALFSRMSPSTSVGTWVPSTPPMCVGEACSLARRPTQCTTRDMTKRVRVETSLPDARPTAAPSVQPTASPTVGRVMVT